jgi:hypothetical protein
MSMMVMALPPAVEKVSGVSSEVVCEGGTTISVASFISQIVSQTVVSELRPLGSIARYRKLSVPL